MELDSNLKRVNAVLQSMYGVDIQSYDGDWDWDAAFKNKRGDLSNKAVDVAMDFCAAHGIGQIESDRDVGLMAVKNLEPVYASVANGSVEVSRYDLDQDAWITTGVFPDGGLAKSARKYLSGDKAQVREAKPGDQGYAVAKIDDHVLMIGRDGGVLKTPEHRGNVSLGKWVEINQGGVKEMVSEPVKGSTYSPEPG